MPSKTIITCAKDRYVLNNELTELCHKMLAGNYTANAKSIKISGKLSIWFSGDKHFTIRIDQPRVPMVCVNNVVRIDGFSHKFTLDTDAKVLIIDDCMAFQY